MTHFWHWQKQLSPKMVCPSTCIALLVVNFEAKRSGSAASGLPNPTPLWEGEVGFPEAQDQQKVFTHPPDTELKFVMPKLKLSSNWHVYILHLLSISILFPGRLSACRFWTLEDFLSKPATITSEIYLRAECMAKNNYMYLNGYKNSYWNIHVYIRKKDYLLVHHLKRSRSEYKLRLQQPPLPISSIKFLAQASKIQQDFSNLKYGKI